MMFTDYYAEASCTAGRANFITGEIPQDPASFNLSALKAKIDAAIKAHQGD